MTPAGKPQLHLLRPFTGRWAKSIDVAERWLQTFEADAEFASWTSRPPKRVDELEGGSCYFAKAGTIIFRMPLVGLDPDEDGAYIVMEPVIVRTVPQRCGFLRGWRYLEDPPEDLREGAEIPADVLKGLQEAGVAL